MEKMLLEASLSLEFATRSNKGFIPLGKARASTSDYRNAG
jgi:hypothetical protein